MTPSWKYEPCNWLPDCQNERCHDAWWHDFCLMWQCIGVLTFFHHMVKLHRKGKPFMMTGEQIDQVSIVFGLVFRPIKMPEVSISGVVGV